MIIYFLALFMIMLWAGLLKNANYSYRRKKEFIIFAFGLLTLIAMLRSSSVGIDLARHYARNYQNIAQLNWKDIPAFSAVSGYEMGFVYFCKILSFVSADAQWFIAVVSIIVYGITARFILKNSENVVLSTFIMICCCSYYMYMNVLRQALAVSIILLGYEYLTNRDMKALKRYFIFTMHVVLAMSFHQSAIICLAFIMFDLLRFERKHIIIATMAVVSFYYLYDKLYALALLMVGNSERYSAHITSIEGVGGIDIMAFVNIVLTFGAFVLGYYTLVWKKKKNMNSTNNAIVLEQENSFLLYASLMAGAFRLLTTQMNILNRATYYFLPFIFVLYPMALNRCGRNKRVVKSLIYVAFFAYFCIMTVRLAGEYYGTVPYKFFWQ